MDEPIQKILQIFEKRIWNFKKKFNELNALWLLIYFDIWNIPFSFEKWREIFDYIRKAKSWLNDSTTLDLVISYTPPCKSW
jgi:hypothetical protein